MHCRSSITSCLVMAIMEGEGFYKAPSPEGIENKFDWHPVTEVHMSYGEYGPRMALY